MNNRHLHYMERALLLAEQGRGQVSPNPLVGCVIVNKGRLVGEGFHKAFGGPHAEIHALQKAGPKSKGATAYLTLEPCTHFGKTPPCAPAVINSGLKEVYIATTDPNPVVAGRGVQALRKAGIKVHVGLGQGPARHQNRAYWTWRTLKRPHVVLKAAMTLDGKIATCTGESRWISGPVSRRLVHKLRAESDAVLIGAQTAIHDNPRLTSHGEGRNPLRVVLDPRLRTPESLMLYRDHAAPSLVVTSPRSNESKARKLNKMGVQILRQGLKFGEFELIKTLRTLSNMNVSQLFVEGGGTTHGFFLTQKLIDEVYLFLAPLLVGGKHAPTAFEGPGLSRLAQGLKLRSYSVTRSGEDILIHGFTRRA